MNDTSVLGISAYYHDSAAALVIDGKIVSAAQEERFTRCKHDAAFPAHAIGYCLLEAGIRLEDVDHIVFYDKPLPKFERLLETYLSYAPWGFRSFASAMPVWLKEKLFLKKTLQNELALLGDGSPASVANLLFTDHHRSHAASAFFASPFERAAVLCIDGVGEWATTSLWSGDGNRLTPVRELRFPHSLGLLYSAFTYYAGFKVNSGEYKLMGLAPYGEPVFVDLIHDKLIDVRPDGSFQLDMRYFNYAAGLTMTNSRFDRLFGAPPRRAESAITQREMDIARSIQVVTEGIVMKLARHAREKVSVDNLCLAGGVALNCVANGKLSRSNVFDNVWVQPAAGDAGGAIGAALSVWHEYLDQDRELSNAQDNQQGSYLGPAFDNDEIATWLDDSNLPYVQHDETTLLSTVAQELAGGAVVGWFQGRMEFGPRALGNRSILGDPRSAEMQSTMNLKIKYRESFRPFAPSVMAEHVRDWFDFGGSSPYMLMVAPVNPERMTPVQAADEELTGLDRLKVVRSSIPAVTHVDGSARIQTVHRETNPRYWSLLEAFRVLTGCPVLINTSFNVRGEPIVCTPQQAYQCFMRTEMDYLVMDNLLLSKSAQPVRQEQDDWQQEFELD